MADDTCLVEVCTAPTYAAWNGWSLCSRHYRRARTHGEPDPDFGSCAECGAKLDADARRALEHCSAACATTAADRPGATKRCRLCRETMPTSSFQRKAASRDGRAAACKPCDGAARTARRIRQGLRRPDPPLGYKYCGGCDTEKPLDEFYKRMSGPHEGKRHGHCIPCVKADNIARGRRNGSKPRQPADPYAVKRQRLASHFNITLDDYWSLLNVQRSRCAGCGLRWDDATQWFSVDHDHRCCPGDRSCGACVCGLLCAGCNFAAGHCRDDPQVLRRLATYLERTAQGSLFRPAS